MVDLPADYDDNPDWSNAVIKPLDTAAKLQATRARLGMSQPAFAKLLHIPLATLRNWEQRRTAPDSFASHVIEVIYDNPEEMRSRLSRPDAA